MTTPGRQAAIEAAAKACGSTIPWATLAIDAYEEALAEQPRDNREAIVYTDDLPPNVESITVDSKGHMIVFHDLHGVHIPSRHYPLQPRGEEERLRKGLEDALEVSFTVGLLRLRASKENDAELVRWGERLNAQLVAIREVLNPGEAAAWATLNAEEPTDA